MNGKGQGHKGNKKKEKTNNIICFSRYCHGVRRSRSLVDIRDDIFVVLRDEAGFLDTFILTTYVVVFITMMAFLMGMGFGNWKQAQAKYGYLAESMAFAVEAANMTGGIEGVEEHEEMAQEFFKVSMEETVGEYTLDAFYAVEEGDAVPCGIAKAPGFVAKVTVPLRKVNVPLIGEQQIRVPMAYFAGTKSEKRD